MELMPEDDGIKTESIGKLLFWLAPLKLIT